MHRIEVFADMWCPFTHVGLDRLIRQRTASGQVDVSLWIRAWPLELVNGTPLRADAVAKSVGALQRQVAPLLFAGFDVTAYPESTLPALDLAAAANRQGSAVGERVGLALRRALFEEGRAIDKEPELAAIAMEYGVERQPHRDREQVLSDWAEGTMRGVLGSPHFFVDGEGFFCPTLTISHVDGGLKVAFDQERFGRFADHCFEPPVTR